MQTYIKRALCAAVLTASLAAAGTESLSAAKLNMGYLYFGTQEAFINQVDATNNAVNLVSPTLFDLTASGELLLASDITALVAAMKERGVKVVPFLSNHWDRELGRKALANREALSSQIAEAVSAYGLDGVNVDIENVTDQDRDAYTDLVRLLRAKLPAGTELSVAVAANPDSWTVGWQGSYDLARLAEYSDYLMLMAYDEHWEGDSTAGPVASLPWVEQAVRQALKAVPADKLLLGIPFYGRFWQQGGGIAGAGIPNKSAEALAARYGIIPGYDQFQESAYFTFTVTAGGERPLVNYRQLEPGTYTVWYDNEQSIKAKLDLVHKYQLRGTGIWCLSQETAETWEYYASWLNGSYYADTAGHWAEAAIRDVAQKGWMTGTASASFAPEQPLKRAEAAAILVRALRGMGSGEAAVTEAKDANGEAGAAGSQSAETEAAAGGAAAASGINAAAKSIMIAADGKTTAASSGSFLDVPPEYWGWAEIGEAGSMGLVDGYEDGSFAPEQPVTREQLAVMLQRALSVSLSGSSSSDRVQAMALSGKLSFTDMSPARWSWTAVAALADQGLLQGYGDGTFRPEAWITRAEAAALLARSLVLP
ncbi:MAG: glycoside hydrolase family protein [Paenibacillaceae bacterium]|jgi:spore germination protein YaaH|nr:glycoside hydrolase family protein [Paenibacillaceae bacterium]